MTGYSKIKRKKFAYGGKPKYPNGGMVQDASQEDDGEGLNAPPSYMAGNNAAQTPATSSGGGMSSAGVSGGLNFLGSTVDSFNTGGTGGGSVALGTASGALKGAAAGTMIMPGIGTAIGAGIGLVSGFIGSEAKRKTALANQSVQRKAVARLAANQSNQVLSQYSNQGVENAQLYADGGMIGDPPTKGKVVINQGGAFPQPGDPYWKAHPLVTEHADGTLRQWGENVPVKTPTGQIFNNNSQGVINPPKGTLPTPVLSDKALGYSNNYYPSVNQQKGADVPTIHSNYSKGGLIKKSHIGRFTAYKERTGESTEEALHSKNSHVRQMAQFAENAKHFKHAYGGRLFADGGDIQPDYEAEGGETVQGQDAQLEQSTPLASDIQQINGPSHEQGGVMGTGGERIFSDRLKVSPQLLSVLKTNGIKVNQNSSYADVSNKLGKLKGKYEDKTDGIGKTTASVMLPRIEQSLDDTFNDQEAGKMTRQYKKFAKGGMIPKFDDGGNPNLTKLQLPNGQLAVDGYNNQNTSQGEDQQQTTTTPPLSNTFIGKAWNGFKDFNDENPGQLENGASYLANLGSINKLNTSVNPQYLASPNYNYVDRSGTAYSRNNSLLKTGVKSLTNSGQTVNASNIAGLFSKELEGNSYIAQNENNRRDAYNEAYNNRADKINAENTGIYNKAQDDSRDLNNQKLALKLGARNAFQQGITGNIAAKQAADLEQKKLLTVLAANDQNGAMTRFLQNYPKYKKLLAQYNSRG